MRRTWGLKGFSRWEGPLKALPPFPPLLKLTGPILHSALQRWPKKKAPGADGWRPSELRQWPVGLLSLLVVFYEVVEEDERWPEALGMSLVPLLVKGGTEDPEDRRPIVLLSAVYRLWACIRAAGMRGWLKEAGVLPPPPRACVRRRLAGL